MAQLISVQSPEACLRYCRELERGNVLFFPSLPVQHPEGLRAFLSQVLAPYAKRWEWGEREKISQQELSLDAFRKRPAHGARVLRLFMNQGPQECRWVTSRSFGELAREVGGQVVTFPRSMGYSLKRRLERKMKELFGVRRSPYDSFMMRLKRFLEKEEALPRDQWAFPPGSAWAFFTDQVAYGGDGALVQTVWVPFKAMLQPELSPISILERLTGGCMIDPKYAGTV